jgi:ATP-dependent helicase YprA (DUF1998 family)
MQTYAFWLVPPPRTLHLVKEFGRDPVESMLAIANVLTEVLPFMVMCDTGDIGSMVDLANNGAPSLFVFDKYPGGLGFAHRAFERVEELLAAARDLIAACPCEAGCPSCVGAPLPPNSQLDPDTSGKGRIPDKEGALVILHDLLELEPYQPRPMVAPVDSRTNPDEALPPYPPLVRLPEKIEQQLREKLTQLRRKS